MTTGKYGVYAIILDGVIRYIGSGGLKSRKSNHLAKLRHGKHTEKLQKEFDRVGEDNFEFFVLDTCNQASLYVLEDLHMKIHKDTIYNTDRVVTYTKQIRTPEQQEVLREKFSKAMTGTKNPNSKLTEQDVETIKAMKLSKIPHKKIAELFDVSVGHIGNIGCSKWVS